MSAAYRFLNYEREGKIARLTLNRPDVLNAVHDPAAREVEAAAAEIARDPRVRVVAVTGEGRAFSTGIDLKDLAEGKIDMAYHVSWERALRSFETMDKIVLCLIHGYALGGGLQLALACDIRVSTPTAQLGLPAIKEGLIPGMGTFRLARYVGIGRAKQMILLGSTISGTEALEIGLVDHVVDENRMTEEFENIVEQYLATNSEGCRLSKRALIGCFDLDFDSFLDRYMTLQDQAMRSNDFNEAMDAYRENREPNWS